MKEKKIYCLSRQRRPQRVNALKTVPSSGEIGRWFYNFGVKRRAINKDQHRWKLTLFFKAAVKWSQHWFWWSFFWNEEYFINCFLLLRVSVLWKGLNILLYIFLEEEPRPCPKAAPLSVDCSSLASASPPFPDEQLPFTQGKSWKAKLVPQKQEMEEGKAHVP